jgi:hypothetical protein
VKTSLTSLLLLVACVPEAGFMPTRPSWSNAEEPFTVCTTAYVGDSTGARKMVGDVLNTIDSRLGFKLYADATAGCDVTILVGVPVDVGSPWSDPGGHASDIGRAEREVIEAACVSGEIDDMRLIEAVSALRTARAKASAGTEPT